MCNAGEWLQGLVQEHRRETRLELVHCLLVLVKSVVLASKWKSDTAENCRAEELDCEVCLLSWLAGEGLLRQLLH